MRTNSKTRETMPQSWIDFFKTYKGKKYFEDGGYKCCAYSPERDHRGVVQTALRRSHGRLFFNFSKEDQNFFESLGFNRTAMINIFFCTCASMHGGMYIYDLIKMRRDHKQCFEWKEVKNITTGKRQKVKATVERGVNDYYEVPLEHCVKVLDVWDLPKNLRKCSLYSCAAWQYQQLTVKDEWDNCAYDKIEKWEDLPDWCFWKYHEADGTLIKGREQQYQEYVNRSKKDSRYIPTTSINKRN